MKCVIIDMMNGCPEIFREGRILLCRQRCSGRRRDYLPAFLPAVLFHHTALWRPKYVDDDGYVYWPRRYHVLRLRSNRRLRTVWWATQASGRCCMVLGLRTCFYHPRMGLVMRSVASVCLSWCSNFWKPWPRKLIFGMQVYFQNMISVMFVDQGHRVRV